MNGSMLRGRGASVALVASQGRMGQMQTTVASVMAELYWIPSLSSRVRGRSDTVVVLAVIGLVRRGGV